MPRLRFAFLLALALAAIGAGEGAAAPTFVGCRANLEHDVECASVPVELDRRKVVPGTLSLHVERIRSRARPARGAVFVLSGGPGESVSAGTDVYADALAPALATNDLILIDQRGTGLSGALSCPAPTSADVDKELGACGAALGARLPLFTVSDVVDDLEHVRRELGLERVTLAGVSYGTRIALAYASRYPQHVERMVLDSVVPLSGPSAFRLNSIAAVPRILGDVCAGACGFTKDANAELAELVSRLAARPLAGRVARGDGRLHPARVGRADLLSLLLAADFLPVLRTHFPAAVHSALAGDPAPLLRLRDFGGTGSGENPRVFSAALFLATTCMESGEPWVGRPTPEERSAAARSHLDGLPDERFAPFDRSTALAVSDLQLCRPWPSGTGLAARFEQPLPDVPTLIVSGTADLRTPLEDAVALAAELPRAQLLPVRGVGHAAMFQELPCVTRALSRFLAGRAAGRCPAVHSGRATAPAPDPRRELTPITAVELTLEDVLGQLPLTVFTKSSWGNKGFLFYVRAGGLRGGRYSASIGSLTLERVVVLPGIAVSGRLKGLVDPFSGTIRLANGSLRVTAPGTGGGALQVRNGHLSGTLGGRPVSRRIALDR